MHESDVIEPRRVPLSHRDEAIAQRPQRQQTRWKPFAALLAAIVLTFLLFEYAPRLVVERHDSPVDVTSAPVPAQRAGANDRLPPYQQLQREQARAQAQEQLAQFVELELRLNNELNVSAWAAGSYDEARLLAQVGDEAFVAERFDAAIASYARAREALSVLIAQAQTRFDTALAASLTAIDARDQAAADAAIVRALTIKPQNTAALEAKRRAALIPEILAALRSARNHELQGEWHEALAIYQNILSLDPSTPGLVTFITNARRGSNEHKLQTQLSRGFEALDRKQFSESKTAFNRALAIDPGNAIALGGLQQTADQAELAHITRLRAEAENAEREERWQAASDAYQGILDLDANIQFARSGKQRATEQASTIATLAKISAESDRLSSDRRYSEAQRIIDRARLLDPRGPALTARIQEVARLLEIYAAPVPVLLRSDNATDIVLSSVGRLGRFAEKQIDLRPGAYTLIGSRDGCRDVRAQIKVRPQMDPVDIRCQERLTQ
ncbi:MAG: hypothetical protein QF921_17575 [Pseudomonadales bacterium]|jgi:tetratricopeptide (TPR) repeat protein|nr:hypothetical protein [Pseudomonadales bacterium]MDP6472877.1 hypothetical protein [Pseudomonadales bacterium]MDP6826367.1 hypothetical protein [Pseudomonadales bacterium]MDP6973297.1 hypothetical protein [Pseudomonadales bacterium]